MDLRPPHRFDAPPFPTPRTTPHPDYAHAAQQARRLESPEPETCTYVVSVDSSQRDARASPGSNRFKVYLRTPICNVLSCRLLTAEVPNVGYTIGPSNQRFSFEEVIDGTSRVASFLIPTGHYDGTTLCAEIQRLMNAFSSADANLPQAPYVVRLLNDRNKAMFETADPSITRFRLLFDAAAAGGTCHGVLGFDAAPSPWNTDPADPASGVDPADPLYARGIVSPRYLVVAGDPYVYLCSPELNSAMHEVVYSKESVGSDVLFSKTPPHAFAKIVLLGPPGSIVFYNHRANHDTVKRFTPPLSRIASLEFEFIRADGSPVDFQNMENSFMLEFTCVSRSLGMPRFENRTVA